MSYCFLILASDAPNYRPIHAALGSTLKKCGNRIVYAVTSRWPDLLHPDHPLNMIVYDFSLFLSNPSNYKNEPLPSNNNIWKMFFPDLDRFYTIGYNNNHKLEWYQNLARALQAFFCNLYTTEKIDFVIYEDVACSFSYFAYKVAKDFDITYIGINSSRMPGRFEIHRNGFDIKEKMSKAYKELSNGEIKLKPEVLIELNDYIENIIDREPDYMNPNQFLEINIIKKYMMRKCSWIKLWRTFKYIIKGERHPYETGNLLIFMIKILLRDISRTFKSILSRRYMEMPKQGERFFLYPIHYHPEASTSIYAPCYIDELNNIRNIALCLPIDSYLYVKEHRSAIGYPKLSFYQSVSKIPNVKLLPPELNARRLIQSAESVITITSTVGYEAILLGKSVFTLGDCFYNFHPLVHHVNSWEELASAIHNDCNHQPNRHDVLAFVGSYWVNTWPGIIDYQFEAPPKNVIDKIAEAIMVETTEIKNKEEIKIDEYLISRA